MNEMNGMSYVKATDLNRGKASSCLKQVHDDNCDMMVLKNSEPYAMIISIEKYQELMEASNKKLETYADMLIKSRKKKD